MDKYILVDTGYWFGLLDPSDSYHQQAQEVAEIISDYTLIIPFPTLYEVLNSSFIKNKAALENLENLIKSEKTALIYDESYRDNALHNVYQVHKSPIPKVALVDSIIREILKDINIKVDGLVTFNVKDFKDLCDIRNISIIP
ncbi:hypothetical protein HYN59_05230 [Flavobacterium album]|uniref:PIN domain-containing protein n=1 Tax=Flavobacterium album TaxID=2175091 RepID=A0A2S1QVZ2_9FLAO|nr:hypothetical protein [Flavobacterium album]AWH84556.1 hypothetical protein HYN59_05230 [Flavobacterium album]